MTIKTYDNIKYKLDVNKITNIRTNKRQVGFELYIKLAVGENFKLDREKITR